jgi:phosphoribosylanthranilate isomerase
MSFLVKICGITRLEDAVAATTLGADALGFMFYERSSRRIDIAAAAEICRELPPGIRRVGVFVDAELDFIESAIEACGLNWAQLHGVETPEFCGKVKEKGVEVVKAFRMADESSLELLERYRTDYWLLDSHVAGALGGTGQAFNWTLARKARRLGGRILLAGGLTPENVGEAVRQSAAGGVDVSSGVESAPGRKDKAKMTAFIGAARSVVPPEGMVKA